MRKILYLVLLLVIILFPLFGTISLLIALFGSSLLSETVMNYLKDIEKAIIWKGRLFGWIGIIFGLITVTIGSGSWSLFLMGLALLIVRKKIKKRV